MFPILSFKKGKKKKFFFFYFSLLEESYTQNPTRLCLTEKSSDELRCVWEPFPEE